MDFDSISILLVILLECYFITIISFIFLSWLPTVRDSADYRARPTTTDSHATETRLFQRCMSV